MLGAIIGDLVGSVYEFNNYKAKDFDPFFQPGCFFTDDTVCTAAVADSLTRHIDPAVALREWGRRYWENGGWGMRFAQWLGDDDEGPYNSYGNGAGMRVSPAGFLARTLEEAVWLSDYVTGVTHNHPQGMRGAAATAAAIYWARAGLSASEIRANITKQFGYDLRQSVDEIRPWYRYNERALDTVPQALTCALEATDFEDAIRNSISIGGDSDTIAAIAGGLAEALFGIPESMARLAWVKLPEDIQAVLTRLYEIAEQRAKVSRPADINAVLGDITKQIDCDGLVNSANKNLREGSGVCGAIHRAAGKELEEHCRAHAPLALAGAVATPAFGLRADRVIHTRGPKYLFDPEPAHHLALAMTNTLIVADKEKLKRLAIPAISMGVYAYPPEEAVPILVETARQMRPRLHYIEEIRFVVIQESLRDLFQHHIRSEACDAGSDRVITPDLLEFLKGHYRLDWNGIHGVKHWSRVRANGLALAKTTGANTTVVELFAFLHDSCRENDGRDPLHGNRASELVTQLQGNLINLDACELELLKVACKGHTHESGHGDPTVATCWDADRLDLIRIDIMPDPDRLCTEAGKSRCMDLIESAQQ